MAGNPPLIVVVGPTAVGKTELAVSVAQAINGEIVSADSRQIYRYMDIGTAKPTPQQKQAVVHHLIDVVNPDESLTLSQYQRLAYEAIHDIHSRGKIPLLVGGTGQYITAVVEGWSIPEAPPNEVLRAELENVAATQGSAALHQQLASHDPLAASKIDHRNVRRVIRALEVCIETGMPISELQKKQPPPLLMLHLGLTMERETLYERANQRMDMMIAEGFVDEVCNLLNMGYQRKLPSMSGLGYAELSAHLLKGLPLAEVLQQAKYNTHDFIRRQFTWFRGHDPGILWHNMDGDSVSVIVERIKAWIQE